MPSLLGLLESSLSNEGSSQGPFEGGNEPADVRRRLAELEDKVNKKQESAFSRIGATLALVISIATGAFTISDRLFIQPAHDRELKLQQLESAVGTITSINQDLISKISAVVDPTLKQSLAVAANTQKMMQVRAAESLLPALKGFVGPAEYAVLSQEKATEGDLVPSRKW
jgi:cytoskeletal protein RodZ